MIYLNDHIDSIDLDEALATISVQRREQALRFRHERGRRLCVAAYLLLKEALSKEYGISGNPLLGYAPSGKPYIEGHPDIHFNLSHCRHAAVCVVSDSPVGVDIEAIRPYNASLARYTMSDDELQHIEAADRRDAAFIRLWTMKEAVLKLSGQGLRSDLKLALSSVADVDFEIIEHPKYICTVCRNPKKVQDSIALDSRTSDS